MAEWQNGILQNGFQVVKKDFLFKGYRWPSPGKPANQCALHRPKASQPKWAKLVKPECRAGRCPLKRCGARQDQAPLEPRGLGGQTLEPGQRVPCWAHDYGWSSRTRRGSRFPPDVVAHGLFWKESVLCQKGQKRRKKGNTNQVLALRIFKQKKGAPSVFLR